MTDTDEAIKNAANVEADAAARAAEAAKADSTEHIAKAAEAATAAATAAKALAETEAATKINENEGNVSWLKQHAETTDVSLRELHKSHQELRESLPGMLESQKTSTLEAIKELLIPAQSTPPENPPVNPTKESEDADARLEAEKKKKSQKGPRNPRNWT